MMRLNPSKLLPREKPISKDIPGKYWNVNSARRYSMLCTLVYSSAHISIYAHLNARSAKIVAISDLVRRWDFVSANDDDQLQT